MADMRLTKATKQKFTRSRRRPGRRRDMAPTSAQLATIQRVVTATAKRFGCRLSPECVEDLVQEVFLGLWQSRAEDKLDCLPYLRRVSSNVTVNLFRRQGAKKRRPHRGMEADLERMFYSHPRTIEETLIEREMALELIAGDRKLERRVRYAMKQFEKAQRRMVA